MTYNKLNERILNSKKEQKMATRSYITVKSGDLYRTVYNHLDGDLLGVGKTLLNHYNSQEAADELIKWGDISSLGEKCDCPEGHSYENPIPGYTVYYGRDRGEGEETKYIVSEQKLELIHDYLYVFEDGKWFVSSKYFEYQELTHELIQKYSYFY